MSKIRMNARYYTLDEARATLPQVKALMADVQAARREILRVKPEAWPGLKMASYNGGSRAAGEIAVHFARLERGVKGILELGVFVKDVDQGLVDFLDKRDGREIFLCWQHGEDDIAFWHEVNAGYAERQPLDDSIS